MYLHNTGHSILVTISISINVTGITLVQILTDVKYFNLHTTIFGSYGKKLYLCTAFRPRACF